MKLSNFENSIDSTILMRGKGYYKSGHIESLEEMSDGEWLALVEGTELYKVDVVLSKSHNIVDHYCNCPYDGYFCKHEVAVFYALSAQLKSKPAKRTKRLTIKKKLALIFDKLSKDELQKYLQDTVLNNKKNRDHFLLQFDYLIGEVPTSDKYRKIVKGLVKSYRYQGFLDYRATAAVCNELSQLLEQARASLKTNPELAFIISRVVIEEFPDMAESMDDSNGESTWICQVAVELLLEYFKTVDGEALEIAFQWAIKIYLDDFYSDYGYDEVDRLFNYFCTQDTPFKEQILAVIDKKIASAGKYELHRRLLDKVELLTMWGDQVSSKKIVMDNLDQPEFRKIIVDENLSEGNYKGAIRLINQGLLLAQKKGHHGVISSWHKQLLIIAKKQKNQEEILRLSRILLSSDFSLDYYRLYKKTSENWGSDYALLIENLADEKDSLAQVYVEEGNHVALFKLVKSKVEDKPDYGRVFSQLYFLKQYMDELLPHYPDEILDLYQTDIYHQAKNTGRRYYEDIARDLKEMKKMEGGDAKVFEIIQDFKQKYANRPAMLEVLSRV